VKRTGEKNPPRPGQPTVIRDAKRAAVKLETRIAKATLIGIDYRGPTEAEKDTAFTKAKEKFDAKLLAVKTLLPDREVMSSITLHAERSSKKFPVECVDGSLVGGPLKNGVHRRFPIVMTETMTDGTKCWRGLGAAERRDISYGKPSELFISDNQELAEFIEDKLHRYMKSLEKTDVNIKLLQILEGNGGARALGPYRVGLNFIVFKEDGSLPLRGAILGKNIPKGMPNKADLKPAAAPRAVKRKVSDNDEENSNTIDLTNESEDEDERD
jgi:hypothetical protein